MYSAVSRCPSMYGGAGRNVMIPSVSSTSYMVSGAFCRIRVTPECTGGKKMNARTYGYVRVSTRDQNEDRQLISMRQFGVDEANVFIDKQSGKDFNRPQYRKLVRKLKCDDTLVIKSIAGSGAIMRRSLSSGGLSPKKKRQLSLCWTCLCWIPGRDGI